MNAKSESNKFLKDLQARVEQYLAQRQETAADPRPAIKSQISTIESETAGLVQSLSNPKLADAVRTQLENQCEKKCEEKEALEQSLVELEYLHRDSSLTIDETDVMRRLERLPDVFGANNPTLAHLELSLHLDRIDCQADGTAVARFCKLGLAGHEFIERMSLKERIENHPSNETACKPRRRARLSAQSEVHDTFELEALSMWATDPDRFAGLDDEWFESVTFRIPERTYWAKEHAIAVAESRLNDHLTEDGIAKKFGTIPTIRKALRIAKELDPNKYESMPRRMARAKWHEDQAKAVFELKSEGMSTQELADHFGKSPTTILKAIRQYESSDDS